MNLFQKRMICILSASLIVTLFAAGCGNQGQPESTANKNENAGENTVEAAKTVQIYDMEGVVFLDGNVSRVRDEGESGISGIKVILKDGSGNTVSQAVTDKDGNYKLLQVPEGEYKMTVDTADASVEGLNYYSKEPEGSDLSDCAPVDKALAVTVNKNTKKDIGLMQGWMTNPFHKEAGVLLSAPVDLDYRLNHYRDFRSIVMTDRKELLKWKSKPWGNDQHQGVDWDGKEGTPILAVAPGVVVNVEAGEGGGGGRSLDVKVLHIIGDRVFVTSYGHNSRNNVKENDVVSRGQVIAFVGHTGTQDNHLHMNFWELPESFREAADMGRIWTYINSNYTTVDYPSTSPISGVPAIIDPFRDVTDSKSENLWTVDNKPQYVKGEDNIDYTYGVTGMTVKGQDLASAASDLVSKQKVSGDSIVRFSPIKGELKDVRNILGICGREEGEVLNKYLSCPKSGESYALNKYDQETIDKSLIVVMYVPGMERIGAGEKKLGYDMNEIEAGIKNNGHITRVYEAGKRTTIVFGAKDLKTLDKIAKDFDFDKYINQ